ncbi:MAG TPA: hypothetical protein VNZ67_03220, partial [bacterium]|nr:hypothetical protein [bacterium]
MDIQDLDFVVEGKDVDLDLLRGVALGGKRSQELDLLINSQERDHADYQSLALVTSNLSVSEEASQATFEALRSHQERMEARMRRPVGIKTAALDLVENIELALKIEDEVAQPSYWQLEQMAYRDQLTGLRNFRFFSGRL